MAAQVAITEGRAKKEGGRILGQFHHQHLGRVLRDASGRMLLPGLAGIQWSRSPRFAQWTFESVTILAAEVGSGVISTLKKRHERRFRVARLLYRLLWQLELAEVSGPPCPPIGQGDLAKSSAAPRVDASLF